jgi:5-methyltetrahydrofolate--homocysteine methyltransferase
MIIIAENFNSSIPETKQAMADKNAAWLIEKAANIADSGANYIDINAGTFLEHEAETLLYVAELIQPTGLPLAIDSPDHKVIEYILRKLHPKQALLNSITLENTRFNKLVPLAQEYDTKLIALLMDGSSMPESVEQRLEIADRMINSLEEKNIDQDRIFLDPMIKPLATDDQAGREAYETIRLIRQKYPDVHITCGLSNISFGLPARKYLNRAFLIQSMAMGLDSAILNPLDEELMKLLHAGESLSGCDEFCCDYLAHFRPKKHD